jgi:hypothetical protein
VERKATEDVGGGGPLRRDHVGRSSPARGRMAGAEDDDATMKEGRSVPRRNRKREVFLPTEKTAILVQRMSDGIPLKNVSCFA